MAFRDKLLESWQQPNFLTVLLWPMSVLYRGLYLLRSYLYLLGVLRSHKASVPVIVVGNITVGGTGKSPLVIYLIELLRAHGFAPGVISRGYKSSSREFPYTVTAQSPVEQAGDEPLMIARRTGVPIVIGPDRSASIELLLSQQKVDVIISDDGLQHLALQRDIELCVVDDTASQTNRHLLPAGPYRETQARLSTVDFVIHHGGSDKARWRMALSPAEPQPLLRDQLGRLDQSSKVHAVAGIGNPQRFFTTCRSLGFDIVEHAYPDHHQYSARDLHFDDQYPILMTEKDAVKCQHFAQAQHWYLPVDATLSAGFDAEFINRLRTVIHSPTS